VNRVSVNKCARCGADMIAPEWSEHVSDRCVRNFWSCEACEYRVEDTIYFSLFGGMSMTNSAEARIRAALCLGVWRSSINQ
jgi:hypothetical protein